MYDRRILPDDEPVLFGNTSALYESDMVMLDHKTGSYWMQFSGEALVGELAGQRLTALPSQTTTWGLWREQFPDSAILSQETGYDRDYRYDPFTGLGERYNEGGEFIFPVSENGRDPRLDPGEVVLGAEHSDGKQYAWPIERIGDGVINDTIGENRDVAVAIFSSAVGPTGAVYLTDVNGQTLTFTFKDGAFIDDQTGSQWTFSGKATSGPLAGESLTPLPTRSSFWFSLITSFPDLVFYDPSDQ